MRAEPPTPLFPPPADARPWDGDPYSQDPSLEPVWTPIWRESLAGTDWLALRASPLYTGWGVPRGHGERVLLVPGFLGTDLYLTELYLWLARIGYRPHFSDIGRNLDCPNDLAGLVHQTVRRIARRTGERVHIIGHSLGGMMARSVAIDQPEDVASVITLGAPFQDVARAHPAMIAATRTVATMRGRHFARGVRPSCFTGHCTCAFIRNMLAPAHLDFPHYAIYSKLDGVVDWKSCRESEPELNDEVRSTHIGLVFHPAAYRAIARRLREASELNARAAGRETAEATVR